MEVDIKIDSKPCPLGSKRIRRIADAVMLAEKASGSLSIYMTDDDTIKELNHRYLGKKNATDVLAFPLDDDSDSDPFLGEVIVSVETARKRVASKAGAEKSSKTRKALELELARYVIHGILHLTGYRDGTDSQSKKMHGREDEMLTSLGFAINNDLFI